MIVPVEKKFREVKIDPEQWDRVVNPDGSKTYTSKVEGAHLTLVKEDNGNQEHAGIGAGKKFTTKDGIADLWELQ